MTLYTASNEPQFDFTREIVTILSLIFTVVSICLSIVEFFVSRQLLSSESNVRISFEVNSRDFKNMNVDTFSKQVVFRQRSFLFNLASLLKIQMNQIELLKPIHTKSGAIFVFNIESEMNDITPIFEQCISNLTLATQIKKSYKLRSTPIISDYKASGFETVHAKNASKTVIDANESHSQQRSKSGFKNPKLASEKHSEREMAVILQETATAENPESVAASTKIDE